MESVVSRAVGASRGLDAAAVRVCARTGEIVGGGFLVEAGHVVTCAHVVARALGRSIQDAPAETDTVLLDFPLVASGVTVRARIAAWHPIQDDDRGDIAVLSLVEEPPAGVLPVSLVASEDLWGHPFRAFGFPRQHDHGVWVSGLLRARQATGWVQMEGRLSGYSVEAGFSGVAVWDDELVGVVGMTVAADARRDLKAAYLIPVDVLIQAWPLLMERTLPPCPYRGLHPFRERDAGVFFGRQDLTDRLVTEVGRRPLVAVVGPSGSGKSSVVFAGVVPQMLQKEGWMSISMRPSQASSPLFALAAALLQILDPDQTETDRLTALGQLVTLLRNGRLPEIVDRVLARAGMTHLLLVVDQFEELFAREGDAAAEFVGVLLSALGAARAGGGAAPMSLTVVGTLRADFLGQALQNPALAVALEGAVTTIGQMSRDQLRPVIEGPLPRGVGYEAGLVERILGDVGEEPGSLPLLEFALTLLWERQDQGRLTHAAYEHLGGVDGALASYAERVYLEQLRPEDQEDARRLLIQLVRPSEVGEPVRRVARRPELGESRWQLGQRLAATRLLVADRDPTGVESVELVHEALIGGWSRLHDWVDDDHAFRMWQERLRGAAADWETVGRDPGGLLRGAPLAEAERWLAERSDDLGDQERQFIQASRTRRDRSVRRLRMAVASLTLLLLLALSLGGVAWWAFNRADDQSRLAQSRALVTRANSLAESQPDVALLLAATAYKIKDTAEATETLTSMASQYWHVDKLLVTGPGVVSDVAFSPTDSAVLAVASDRGVTLWDTKKNILLKRHEAAGANELAYSPNGRIVAYTQANEREQTLTLWFPAENRVQEISRFGSDGQFLGVTFSPDGELLGACVQPNTQLPKLDIQLWTVGLPGDHHSIPLSNQYSQCAFGFTAAHRGIAYIEDDEIVTWDIAEGRVSTRIQPLPPPRPDASVFEKILTGFAVAPDGRTAMYGDSKGRILWWNLERQGPLPGIEMPGSAGGGFASAFTLGGRLGSLDIQGSVVLVDVARRMPINIYRMSSNSFGGGALSPDGHWIAASGGGRVITLTETRAHKGLPVIATQVAVQSDGEHLTTVSDTGEVVIHSMENPDRNIVVPAAGNEARSGVADDLSPDGLRYATAGDPTHRIHLRDLSSPRSPEVFLEGHRSEILEISFAPSSDFLASADLSQVVLWSAKDRAMASRIPLPYGYVTTSLAVSPDGRYVATSKSRGETLLWDTTSNDPPTSPLPIEGTTALTFSPDGRWLGIGSQNEIRLWNLQLGQIDPRRIPIPSTAKIRFSPDGNLLAASDQNAYEVTVWNMRDSQIAGKGQLMSLYGYTAFGFTPDSARLAGGGTGVFLGYFDASRALQHVCHIMNRNLTEDEWNQHAEGFDYIEACP